MHVHTNNNLIFQKLHLSRNNFETMFYIFLFFQKKLDVSEGRIHRSTIDLTE